MGMCLKRMERDGPFSERDVMRGAVAVGAAGESRAASEVTLRSSRKTRRT
jgi:hypothetical protein